MKSLPFAALAAAWAFGCAAAQAAPLYHVSQDLGDGTVAAHVSPRGTIEGTTQGKPGTWVAGTWRQLPRRDRGVQVTGVNDRGQMSGYQMVQADGSTLPEVILVMPRGGVTALSQPQPDGFLEVGGIAHDGTVIGSLNDPATGQANCESWRNAVMTTIGLPPGGWACFPRAINGSGQIAGEAGFEGTESTHLFLYDHGTWTDVPGLSGIPGGQVAALSDSGHIAGQGYGDADGNMHGLFWDGSRSVDIGTLGGRESGATGVDPHDTVVGWSLDASNAFHAVVWKDGQLTDLATAVDNLGAGWQLVSAVGITNDGTIVVNAIPPSLPNRILLLTPVAP